MFARDYRAIGRAALTGHVGQSLGTTLVAVLLGATVTGTGASNAIWQSIYNYGSENPDVTSGYSVQLRSLPFLAPFFVGIGFFAIAYLVVTLLLGGATTLGLRHYNIMMVTRQQPPQFGMLFSRYSWFGRALWLQILVSLYSTLWALLFALPGAIVYAIAIAVRSAGLVALGGLLLMAGVFASLCRVYLYSMSSYVMAQNPNLTATQAISHSKQIMQGNRWRLFCLQFSFFGWMLLAMLTLGIGLLWLNPYMAASEAAFFLHLTGQLPVYGSPQPQQPYNAQGYGYGAPPSSQPYGAPPQPPPPTQDPADLDAR